MFAAPRTKTIQPAHRPGPHPLDFLRVSMTGGDFAVWIAPLQVEEIGLTHRITARTQLAVDRVRKDWGGEIAERLGPITWSVQRKEAG